MRFLRGQITLEYMVLSLVVLALLAISVSTLIEIQASSSEAMDNIMFRKSALDLHGTVEEVCALGVGNRREVILSRGIEVSRDEDSLLFTNDEIGASMAVPLICPKDVETDYLGGHVIIINDDTQIVFE